MWFGVPFCVYCPLDLTGKLADRIFLVSRDPCGLVWVPFCVIIALRTLLENQQIKYFRLEGSTRFGLGFQSVCIALKPWNFTGKLADRIFLGSRDHRGVVWGSILCVLSSELYWKTSR